MFKNSIQNFLNLKHIGLFFAVLLLQIAVLPALAQTDINRCVQINPQGDLSCLFEPNDTDPSKIGMGAGANPLQTDWGWGSYDSQLYPLAGKVYEFTRSSAGSLAAEIMADMTADQRRRGGSCNIILREISDHPSNALPYSPGTIISKFQERMGKNVYYDIACPASQGFPASLFHEIHPIGIAAFHRANCLPPYTLRTTTTGGLEYRIGSDAYGTLFCAADLRSLLSPTPICPAPGSTPRPIIPATGEKIKLQSDFTDAAPHSLD